MVILVTLGCVDFSRAVHLQIALCNVARVGAEYGAMNPFTEFSRGTWESTLRSTSLSEANALPGFNASRMQLQVDTRGESRLDRQVIVTAEYRFNTIVSWPGLPHQFPLRHKSGMHQYR